MTTKRPPYYTRVQVVVTMSDGKTVTITADNPDDADILLPAMYPRTPIPIALLPNDPGPFDSGLFGLRIYEAEIKVKLRNASWENPIRVDREDRT